jgi:hypothetical protein
MLTAENSNFQNIIIHLKFVPEPGLSHGDTTPSAPAECPRSCGTPGARREDFPSLVPPSKSLFANIQSLATVRLSDMNYQGHQ